MKDHMDDGEVELSGQGSVPNPDSSSSLQCSASVDSYLDEFGKNNRTCTHTHTCNPPGPDANHTHTCYHTHTQFLAPEEADNTSNRKHYNLKAKRPSGNREAVRKYREKKKAHTAYLEEEVKKLRLLNQQLVRKLQGEAILAAEALRLKSLLVDLREKIDNEVGTFPFQKNPTAIFKEGDCGLQPISQQCQRGTPCLHPLVGSSQASTVGGQKLMESWEESCQPPITDSRANANGMYNTEELLMDTVETLVSSGSYTQ